MKTLVYLVTKFQAQRTIELTHANLKFHEHEMIVKMPGNDFGTPMHLRLI